MINSVFLFTGENTYHLIQEFQRRKSSFIEKFGNDCVFQFNNESRDIGSIKQALYGGGLFTPQKMVIIEGVPKDMAQEGGISTDKIDKFLSEFENNLNLLSNSTTIIFLSHKPDKRTKAYKWISENVNIKTFAPLKENELKSFIKEKISPLSIGSEEIDYFLEKIGDNMFRITNEIEKLKFGFDKSTIITKNIIDEYCFGITESNVFALFDLLFNSPQLAVQQLKNMQDEGKDRNSIIGPITRTLRTFLTLIDYGNKNIRDAKQIISETKLPPFTISKNIKNIDILLSHQKEIKNLFKEILNIEFSIKNGEYPDNYFWLAIKKLFLKTNFN